MRDARREARGARREARDARREARDAKREARDARREARDARILFVFFAAFSIASSAFAQSTHLLIVVGLAGDPEHGELFKKWGTTLASTATEKLGVEKDHVILLADQQATRDAVVKAFGTLAAAATEDDTVAIVLFGHGTYANKSAKFNLVGPDMTAEDFAPLLAKLKSKRVVFVNTASASAPFVEALSGPGRVIVTATRTGGEMYATLFGGPFVEAFSLEAADADRDGKVSFLEAFEYARKTVAAAYQREGLLPTEHSLLTTMEQEGVSSRRARRRTAATPRC
jgi:hypothetical protein